MPCNQPIPTQLPWRFTDWLPGCFKECALFFILKKGNPNSSLFKKKKKKSTLVEFGFDPNRTQPSCAENLLQGLSSRSRPVREPVSGHRKTGWAEGNFPFPASGRQRLPRLFPIKLTWNKLACDTKPRGRVEPGATAWLPADLRAPPQFWRLKEFTSLNARCFVPVCLGVLMMLPGTFSLLF